MRFLTFFFAAVFAGLTLTAEPSLADALPKKCWLAQEVKRGAFTIKVFLTERHEKILEAENLLVRHPHGQPGQPVGLSEGTRRRMFFQGPYPMYLEIWHANRLLYVLNEVGSFENFAGFEKILMGQMNFPEKDFITYALYFNTKGSSALTGQNIMLAISPKEERFTAYQTDCHYDILYERVTGGYPDDEFERAKPGPGGAALRRICDPTLDNYGGLGQGGLPRPVRQIVFDAKAKKWRADRPGEFPDFYWGQVPLTLDYSGLEIASQLPESASRAQVEKSGRELMAEIVAGKTEFIKKTKLDLAFVTYSLIMMGLPEQEVRDFFLTLAAEYVRAKGGANWAKAPEKTFDAIVAAAKDFQPIERDEIFRYR